jgi:glycogen(starch) synthase
MHERWGEQYLLVGPKMHGFVEVELEAQPLTGWLDGAVDDLRARGRDAVSGHWLVAGRPQVILVDPTLSPERLEVLRHRLHRDHDIPPGRGNALLDSVIGFGDAVLDLLELLSARAGEPRLLAQFHEWLGGLALPLVRSSQLPYASVFTTHATSVGRYVASSGEDLYDGLATLDAERPSASTRSTRSSACAPRRAMCSRRCRQSRAKSARACSVGHRISSRRMASTWSVSIWVTSSRRNTPSTRNR